MLLKDAKVVHEWPHVNIFLPLKMSKKLIWILNDPEWDLNTYIENINKTF